MGVGMARGERRECRGACMLPGDPAASTAYQPQGNVGEEAGHGSEHKVWWVCGCGAIARL